MRKTLAVLVLFLVLLSTLPSTQTQTKQPAPISASVPLGSTDYPWTMFHHDPLRTGASLASAPSTANPAWSYSTNGAIYASPAVSDGLIFISSWDGTVYALNENTGALVWSMQTGASIYSSPAVANGIVYVGSRNGGMYAINEQTGALIWVYGNPNCAITSSPAVADGKVFYGTWSQGGCIDPGQFVARYANNGTLAWTNPAIAASSVRSSPAVDSGLVFFGQDNGSVMALNETTGQQLWTRSLNGVTIVGSAPAVYNGRIYVGTDNGFFQLNEFTGARITPFLSPNSNTTSAAVAVGAVYFGSGTGYVYKVNATTGGQIWRATIGTAVNSSPALALGTGTVLVGANDGYLYALNMTTGGFVWRYLTGGQVSSSPAIADGRAFVGSLDFKLYAIGTAPPPPPSLKVGIFPGNSTLKPGQVSLLTMTVTNGTSPESGANLTLTSTAGGGFTLPVERSPGLYVSNYTAPLTFTAVATSIRVVAAKPGFLDGSAQTSIALQPFPALTISLTVDQTSVSPGSEILLTVRVLNGTTAVPGATITPSPTGAGTFSTATDAGNGSYTLVFSVALQVSGSNTLTVLASKPGFSPAQTQVTVTVGGLPDLQKSKLFGLPLLLLAVALGVLLLIVVGALAKRRREAAEGKTEPTPAVPSYAVKRPAWFPGRLN